MKVISLTSSSPFAQMISAMLQELWGAEFAFHHLTPDSDPDALDGAALVVVDWAEGAEACSRWISSAKSHAPEAAVVLFTARDTDRRIQPDLFARVNGVIARPSALREYCALFGESFVRDGSVSGDEHADYVSAFVKAARKTFAVMCKMDLGQKSVSALDGETLPGEYSAVMRFGGRSKGWMAVSMSGDLAAAVARGMVGCTVESDDDIRDALGELINVIAGQAKAALVDTPFYFSISAPEVVTGDVSGPECFPEGTGMSVAFDVDGREIFLQAHLASNLSPE